MWAWGAFFVLLLVFCCRVKDTEVRKLGLKQLDDQMIGPAACTLIYKRVYNRISSITVFYLLHLQQIVDRSGWDRDYNHVYPALGISKPKLELSSRTYSISDNLSISNIEDCWIRPCSEFLSSIFFTFFESMLVRFTFYIFILPLCHMYAPNRINKTPTSVLMYLL